MTDADAYEDLVQSGVPIFRSFRACMQAMKALGEYNNARQRFRRRPSLHHSLSEGQLAMLRTPECSQPADCGRLLADAGVPLAREKLWFVCCGSSTRRR